LRKEVRFLTGGGRRLVAGCERRDQALEWCVRERLFCDPPPPHTFTMQNDDLPRQARVKHKRDSTRNPFFLADGLCAVYSKTNWSVSVFPDDCTKAAANENLGTKWKHDTASGHLEATEWVRKTHIVCAVLDQKMMILPRQARDSHRESTQKEWLSFFATRALRKAWWSEVSRSEYHTACW
jgi:hypothetical protein